MQDRKLGKKS